MIRDKWNTVVCARELLAGAVFKKDILQKRYDEKRGKGTSIFMMEDMFHLESQIKEYDNWIEFLKREPQSFNFVLDYDDYCYFLGS